MSTGKSWGTNRRVTEGYRKVTKGCKGAQRDKVLKQQTKHYIEVKGCIRKSTEGYIGV